MIPLKFVAIISLLMIMPLDRVHSAIPQDSVKTYVLKEVLVTSKISGVQGLSTIGRETIEQMNGTGLGDFLSLQPGIFVRDYGIGGSLQTLSFRGTGAEQTLVMIDGVAVTNDQLGVTDLRLIPVEDLEEIQIIRGGGSSLYGANALGGVVNLISRRVSSAPSARVTTSIGSYGARRFSVAVDAAPGTNFGLALGGTAESGRGDFRFLQQGREVLRRNSDYSMEDFVAKGSWSPSLAETAQVRMTALRSDRGTPGPFLTEENQGIARQYDEQLHILGSWRALASARLRYSVIADIQDSYEHYTDAGLFKADNFYRNVSLKLTPRVQFLAGPSLTLSGGAEAGHSSAYGNALPGEKTRDQASIFSSAGFQPFGPEIECLPSLRYDRFSPTGGSWSPRIGLSVTRGPFDAGSVENLFVQIHSTIGKDFRVPTFNELYYSGAGGYGNPLVVPEHSVSFDAGVTSSADFLGSHEISFSYYSIRTRDRLLWLPTAMPLVYSPQNIGETRSTGFDLAYSWKIPFMKIEAGYSWLDARKASRSSENDPTFDRQLPYVPLETANFSAMVSCAPAPDMQVSLWIGESYIGRRFVTEDNSESIPPSALLNANTVLQYSSAGISARLKFEVNNLGDVSYVNMPGYPMPSRNFSLTLSLTKS